MNVVCDPLEIPEEPPRWAVWTKRVVLWVISAALVALLFLFCCLLADRVVNKEQVPSVFGYSPLTVLTGSMEPEISAGDMVIIKQSQSYGVGDVVTYYPSNGGTPITHRIISVEVNSGVVYYTTQGDANNAADTPFPASQVIGKVVAVIPDLGIFLEWLKTPSGIAIIVLFACIVVTGVYLLKA